MAYFPDLTVPKEIDKIEEWGIGVLEGIEKYYSAYYDDYRQRDFENFNLYNGIFDKEQYAYVTDTYSQTSPARLVNYSIMKHMIDSVVGEYLSQPLRFSVEVANKDAVSQKHERKVGFISEALLRPYRAKIEEMMGFGLTPDTIGLAIPDNIDEFSKMTFRENVEDVVHNGLDHLIEKHRFQDTFKRGLYDLCISGKEFYKAEIVGNDPVIRRVDPRNIIYDIDVDREDLTHAEFIAEQRLITVSDIIHEFREWLHPEDIRTLEELRSIVEATLLDRYDEAYRWFKFYNSYLTHIRVVQVEFRAHREVMVKVSENKYDPEHPFIKVLPDDYEPKKGEKIEYREVVEVWEATRIGPDIYVRIRPSPIQVRREEWGYADVPMSYVGAIHYNIDGRTISLVDVMKNLAILYNITMYNIELVMARSAGKAVVYDVAQKPGKMEIDDIVYQAKNHGFIWINSAQEGMQLRTGFNQFQQIDFAMSNALTQLINLKLMIEQTLQTLTGLNPARLGAIQADAPVGTTESKVQQSSFITQPLFYLHKKTIEDVMTRLTDLIKRAWAGRKEFVFPLGERGVKFLKLLADEDLNMNDYAIHIRNSFKDMKNKQVIEGMSEAALRGGQITFLDLIKTINADTAKEAEKVLEKSLKATQQLNEQIRQQEMQIRQEANQVAAQGQQVKVAMAQGQDKSRVAAAQIAAEGKMETERIEQRGKKDYEDHRYLRDLDRRAFEEGAINQEPTLLELSREGVGL